MEEVQIADSSWVNSASYDEASQELHTNLSGVDYTYYGVPPDVVKGLASAGSAGGYMNGAIKGVYSYQRR
jgi:hypothetical protein